MTMLGYTSKILRIDLTNKTSSVEPLNMDWAEKYIGSKGLAIKYLYEELEPGIDPLGPDNKLLFTTGPMTGTPVPCSGSCLLQLNLLPQEPSTTVPLADIPQLRLSMPVTTWLFLKVLWISPDM